MDESHDGRTPMPSRTALVHIWDPVTLKVEHANRDFAHHANTIVLDPR